MSGPSLSYTINTDTPFTSDLIHKWTTAIPDLVRNGVMNESELDPNLCDRYMFDFYGLLLNIGIEPKYHYPHLLVNGYISPTEYTGRKYNIILLQTSVLENYYKAFTK